jgi:hypothetical protein
MFIYRRPLSAVLAGFITLFMLLSIDALAARPSTNADATASGGSRAVILPRRPA